MAIYKDGDYGDLRTHFLRNCFFFADSQFCVVMARGSYKSECVKILKQIFNHIYINQPEREMLPASRFEACRGQNVMLDIFLRLCCRLHRFLFKRNFYCLCTITSPRAYMG